MEGLGQRCVVEKSTMRAVLYSETTCRPIDERRLGIDRDAPVGTVGAVVPLPNMDIGATEDNAMLMDNGQNRGFVVLPGSFARFGWDIFLFFALMYSCLVPGLHIRCR